MTNLEKLKQLENIFPRWVVTNHYCYMPISMEKEDGHVIYGNTWDSLDKEEVNEIYNQGLKWSKEIRESLKDKSKLERVILDGKDTYLLTLDSHRLSIPVEIYNQEIKYKKNEESVSL